MKKMVVLLSCMAFGMVLRANAQTTPIVDQRQTYQRERIQAGVAHDDLTRRETANAVRTKDKFAAPNAEPKQMEK